MESEKHTFDLNTTYMHEKDCQFYLSTYRDNDNLFIGVLDSEGEPYCDVTVNLGVPLDPDCAAIKYWSENSGMMNALEEIGVIKENLGFIPHGYMLVPAVRFDMDKVHALSNEWQKYQTQEKDSMKDMKIFQNQKSADAPKKDKPEL